MSLNVPYFMLYRIFKQLIKPIGFQCTYNHESNEITVFPYSDKEQSPQVVRTISLTGTTNPENYLHHEINDLDQIINEVFFSH